MSLSPGQFERAAELEAHQQRLAKLQRMSYRELQLLLTGDPAEAALWVRSAAEYGVPAAQLRLGRMLLEGSGVERDQGAAFNWFARAADRGDAEAMNMAGRCHENGWGVAVDLVKAAGRYRLRRKPATTGASTTSAICYSTGAECPRTAWKHCSGICGPRVEGMGAR